MAESCILERYEKSFEQNYLDREYPEAEHLERLWMLLGKRESAATLLNVGAAFGVWTVLGLFWATRLYYAYNQDQHVVPWSATITWGLIDFYVWGLLSPVVILLTRKVRFERESWLVPALIHVPLSVALAALQLLIFSGLFMLAGGLDFIMKSYTDPDIWTVWGGMVLGKLHSSILVYWGILMATLALDYYRRFRDEKLRAAEIETRLAKAELAALRMQLHPHFLFNTLNTIASLVREQPEEAERIVVRLADLLRASLNGSADSEIPLRDELSFIRKYLEIELIRFEDRLQVDWNIDDETLAALTPALILQPLVENAVKHGVAPLERNGVLTVSARRSDSALVLRVSDNGPGLPDDWESVAENRIGLTNTRERLKQLFGNKQLFSLERLDPKGTLVTIEIPFKLRSEDSELSDD